MIEFKLGGVNMDDCYKILADIISESNNIVFFGGAGVSTECGIPDFRSQGGLYNKNSKYNYPPEVMLSHSFFINHTDLFYSYIKDNLMYDNVLPNDGHKALAKLEEMGKLKAVITQNIDGLHQSAGSKNVIELHGSLKRFYCTKCHKNYDSRYIKNSKSVPVCECGGIVRPDIVLYEEALNENAIISAVNYIQRADVLIVAGTSLVVYPAAGLIEYFKGRKLIIINKSSTNYDGMADVVIDKPFAKTMQMVMNELKL